jgi:hypothetical protein
VTKASSRFRIKLSLTAGSVLDGFGAIMQRIPEDTVHEIGRKQQGLINLELFPLFYNIETNPVVAEFKVPPILSWSYISRF